MAVLSSAVRKRGGAMDAKTIRVVEDDDVARDGFGIVRRSPYFHQRVPNDVLRTSNDLAQPAQAR
jgi:hypothetical protein